MDKTAVIDDEQGSQCVIGARGTKTQHQQGSGDRGQNTMAVIGICADGRHLRPTLIYKGQRFNSKWMKNNVADASITCSGNGWTHKTIGLKWIQDFDMQTREKAAGRTQYVYLDGPSSHYALPILRYAKENNIELLGYPPHCTH
ncbi:hypothetical protein PUNSTDRAFT_67272, partial [Punctularia strigosozonata HHB-11173 SS5]|uniref:uncharacterized protein n=1 Tax=Punctularia strigosozonata (strain HHB-11173) TaxID=741275 RepID=UPI0004417FE2